MCIQNNLPVFNADLSIINKVIIRGELPIAFSAIVVAVMG